MTHGNGPQVGNVMRRVEIAAQHHVYPLPLDTVVADTQAGMGYMISQCLMNELASRGKPRLCSTMITTVRVDKDDPAFEKPTKPIGPFLSHEQAEKHMKNDGWQVVEDSGRGWRRVVSSPYAARDCGIGCDSLPGAGRAFDRGLRRRRNSGDAGQGRAAIRRRGGDRQRSDDRLVGHSAWGPTCWPF